MHVDKLELAKWSFSPLFLDYIAGKERIQGLFGRTPGIESFAEQIAEKKANYPAAFRPLLVDTIRRQYEGISLSPNEQANLEQLLSDTTFTVTTGHQLNLCTGPLYFIYKIVTVINACTSLKKQYPQFHFVPVYWMASEDHDFAEINHFRLYGKTHAWETDQKGAVGRFTTETVSEVLNELPDGLSLFQEAYRRGNTLSDAVRNYVHTLFGPDGLLVLDADDRGLKAKLQHVVKADLFEQIPRRVVEETNRSIDALGYKTQVYVRDINHFFLDEGIRGRIELENAKYHVLDTGLAFTAAQIGRLVDEEPEKFSPNVVLRPLYEEIVLPNLAYVGGPAEIVYWLQLKRLFDHFQIPFPILLPRNFGLIVDAPTSQKIRKTGLAPADFFKPRHEILNDFALQHAKHQIQLNGEKTAIGNYFNTIRQHVEQVDKSLGQLVLAESHKTLKGLEKIEEKLLKAEKRFLSDKLSQLEAIKDKLFPDDHLQERTDNFLNFYLSDPHFIRKLISCFDPFDFRFHLVTLSDD